MASTSWGKQERAKETHVNRIQILSLCALAALLPAAHAQGCFGLPPMQPVVPCASQLKALCLCAGTVGLCHWT